MDININDHESDDANGDGEGVWSPDIEQCFREALLLFPPCGRRKHILQEEGGGKMYGRNELIARHIMMRTGKSRTRKQVSSHIQVLARRKAKAEAASIGSRVSPSPSSNLRTQSVSSGHNEHSQQAGYYDVWTNRPIVTQKIRLVEFSAFIEHRNFHYQAPGSINNVMIQQTSMNPPNGQAGSLTSSDTSLQSTQPSTYNPPQQHQATHPLASNHHLPAQFNQASYQANCTNQVQPHHSQKINSPSTPGDHCSVITNNNIQQPQPSTGFTRHSYVQIDYRQVLEQHTNKLERIDISQIQDKFPEIGGSEGLFQRGPSDAFFLVKFWADLNNDYEYNIEDQNSYFGFSSHFETVDPYKSITCSTKACSYGLQVVEKVEKIYGTFNSTNGRYSYNIGRSPMCEFMIQFIRKLRQLPRASQMNSVLENFTVLQVITVESSSEILLCLAYVFEVASSEQNEGPQHHVYRLTKE